MFLTWDGAALSIVVSVRESVSFEGGNHGGKIRSS